MKYTLIFMLLLSLVSCVQSPTKDTRVVDDRSGLTFDLPNGNAASYELKVDGVSYGEVGQYQEGEKLLTIVDGSHRIELIDNGHVVFSKKIYLGAGVNRVIKVGPND